MNWLFKKQRNECASLMKNIKIYLKCITDTGLTTIKEFWKFIKPFITNKRFLESNDIILKVKSGLITDEAKVSEDFNGY